MPVNRAEWILRPSGIQRRIETLAWVLAALLMVATFFGAESSAWLLTPVLPLLGAGWAFWRKRVPQLIGKANDGWWVLQRNQKVPVSFRSGSIRRRQLIVLVWGFWPWQVIIIRPDCFLSREPFNHLKYELYGSL